MNNALNVNKLGLMNIAEKLQGLKVIGDKEDCIKQLNEIGKRIEQISVECEFDECELYDEAWNMAHTLQDIEKEVKDCAFCGGREDNGYSAMKLLKELCYIFTRDVGYHRMDKYDLKKMIEKKKDNTQQ